MKQGRDCDGFPGQERFSSREGQITRKIAAINYICRGSRGSYVKAYPAAPDSEYGWEKFFSERLHIAYRRNYGLQTHVARLHNIFGPEGTWTAGREKPPAAICRKIAMARIGDEMEMWDDGEQTSSFLYNIGNASRGWLLELIA